MLQMSRDTPLISEDELPALLEAVPAWELDRQMPGGARLVRRFTAKNFMAGWYRMP
jgi:pterin-4a-carbinolamine dehydratase